MEGKILKGEARGGLENVTRKKEAELRKRWGCLWGSIVGSMVRVVAFNAHSDLEGLRPGGLDGEE